MKPVDFLKLTDPHGQDKYVRADDIAILEVREILIPDRTKFKKAVGTAIVLTSGAEVVVKEAPQIIIRCLK
jgi:hypothetical protein